MSEESIEDIISEASAIVDVFQTQLDRIESKLDSLLQRIKPVIDESEIEIETIADLDIASFIYGKKNTCTILSKVWTDAQRIEMINMHRNMGCNHFVVDLLCSNNWSEESLPDYWNGEPRQDVHIGKGEESEAVRILTMIRDAGMSIAAYHANDGKDDINNESVWTDEILANYWTRIMRKVATTKYKDGSPLVKEIIFKREFDDVGERSINSVINMLKVIRNEMIDGQTLWTHNESFNPIVLESVFQYIDGLRIQSGGDNICDMIDNNRDIMEFCVEHGKLFKFAEYPVNGVFNGFEHPEYGDELISIGLKYPELFKGVDMYCTVQDINTSFSWDKVDVVGNSFGLSNISSYPERGEISGLNIHRGNYWGDESWYCNISYDGLEDWIGYDVFGDGKILDGRQYILVERDGRWICAFFEWFGKWSENGLHAWGNLNFDHTNLLKGTPLEYPWQPKSGEKYGFILATVANAESEGKRARTPIYWFTWPQ